MVFYGITAAVALLFAVVFCVFLFRKSRKRNAFDVIVIIIGTLILLASLVSAAFAAVLMFEPFGLSAGESGDNLAFAMNGKTLFSVPKIGQAAGLFADLGIVGLAVPLVVFCICLMAVIAVGVKTRGKKLVSAYEAEFGKENKKDKAEEDNADTDVANTADSSEDSHASIYDGDNSRCDSELNENAYTDEQSENEKAHEPEDIPPETAQTIFDEIDKLVTGSENGSGENHISNELKRAIQEGYELTNVFGNIVADDTADRPKDVYDKKDADGIKYELDGIAEDSDGGEELSREESEEHGELSEEEQTAYEYEDSAFGKEESAHGEDIADVPEEVDAEIVPVEHRTVVHEKHKRIIPIEEPEHVPDKSKMPATRVRTIIRRPTAKNIAEIERRAENIMSEEGNPAPSPAAAKVSSKQGQGEKNGKKQEEDRKQVVAETGGLPLTRKYIILNRRNAAAVFNDYLNSKRRQEKDEITGSLNTIIMK